MFDNLNFVGYTDISIHALYKIANLSITILFRFAAHFKNLHVQLSIPGAETLDVFAKLLSSSHSEMRYHGLSGRLGISSSLSRSIGLGLTGLNCLANNSHNSSLPESFGWA